MKHSLNVDYAAALWFGIAMCVAAVQVARPQETHAPPSGVSAPAPPEQGQARNSSSLPDQPSSYHVTGIVIDAVTKSPIPNATLTAAPMTTVKRSSGSRRHRQNQGESAACQSGSDGRFDLSVPAAGGWTLTASARRYRTEALDEHDGYSTAVVVTEAAPRFDVIFRMTPASAIQGFILDEGGEAVRDATVALIYLPPPTPDHQRRRPENRSQQMTDDRGFYKFGSLGPGSYQIRVTAHPWYATAPHSGSIHEVGFLQPDGQSETAGVDPLDVVYAAVWYPGVTDPATATPILLHGGETQDANFRLLPEPGSHLRVTGPADYGRKGVDTDRDVVPPLPNTYVTRLLPDGTEDEQKSPSRMDGHGNADIAGLSPGTYLVHQQPSNGTATLSTIQIGAGSPRTVDLSEGVAATVVTIQVDAAAEQESLQISFRELETGHTTYAQRSQDAGVEIRKRTSRQRKDGASQDDHSSRPDRTASLLPGKYEIFLNGVGDLHLASIDASGAAVTGRIVTIGSGTPKLLLHTASGLGTVTGIVTFHGQPLAGAMVMLIPATLGDPSGLDLPSRDQSNTDGSFEMSGLLPGGYILVAIDHGWEVNWSDPSTLRHYLMHGIPLDIKPGGDQKQAIEAQSP